MHWNQPRDLRLASRNIQSAQQHPDVIKDYLQMETHLQNIIGPFPSHKSPEVHINYFGVIPRSASQESGDLLQTYYFQKELV